ncbi:hypothetical protein HLV39_12215 [Marinobacter adhaerens]|uniref:DUF551 domain-containing protein n=1 Tax=Marinobacter adhaerens TaxID=1033846 RepID=A0A851HTB6_9GAMM|nr:hypothetical protein [Marinobacter adhaerens]NWN92257.1 hypothetical protein [Marinobacter adhaerens]
MNVELKPIAESKVRQLGGEIFGVVFRDRRGRFATISEMGFVTWLDDDKAEPEAARAQSGHGGEPVAAYRYRVIGDPQGWEYSSEPLFGPESGPGPKEEYQALTLDQLLSELNDTHPQTPRPEAEPVFWWDGDLSDLDDCVSKEQSAYHTIPLYTQPQPAQQGSVPEDWQDIIDRIVPDLSPEPDQERYPAEWALFVDRQRIRRELSMLSTKTTSASSEWVRCEERLPTEADADRWGEIYCWIHGQVARCSVGWLIECCESNYFTLNKAEWMPTGIKPPQPPREQEGE